VLRIDAMVYSSQRREMCLAGRVICQGQEVEFCVPHKELNKDTAVWIDRLLMDHVPALATCAPSWSRHIIPIAQLFQHPEVIHGIDRVGYDSEHQRFVFPKFTIETGGAVSELKYPVFPEPVPAADLQLPEALSPEEIDRPKNRCEQGVTEVFWAMAACVLANILARVNRKQPCGIALQGHVAAEVGRAVARAFGCLDCRPFTVAELVRARLAEQCHDWGTCWPTTIATASWIFGNSSRRGPSRL
jgi:hypothetical protein